MMDDRGRRGPKEAGPSTPVEILGFGDVLVAFRMTKKRKTLRQHLLPRIIYFSKKQGKLSLDNLFDQIQAK